MTILHIHVTSALAWLLAVAFAGAGLANGLGGAEVQAEFKAWGYPAWWNFVTAAVEILDAVLIVFPATRLCGLALGAVVLLAALATIIWRRAYKHMPPAVAFAVLMGIELVLLAR